MCVCRVQCRNEVPRITELLIELPAEIDVEGLLARAVAPPDINKVVPDNVGGEPADGGVHWALTTYPPPCCCCQEHSTLKNPDPGVTLK